MVTITSMGAPSFGGLKKSALIVIGAVALYFGYRYTLHYFLWSAESYGYYWEYRVPLSHMWAAGSWRCSSASFNCGPGSRAGDGTHPVSGRIYVTAVIVGSLAGMVLSISSALYGFAGASESSRSHSRGS